MAAPCPRQGHRHDDDEIKGDLAALNIKHDVFFSERSLIENGNNRVNATIDFLRSKGDVYEGAATAQGRAGRGL